MQYNKIDHKDYDFSVKRNLTMDKIERYIDVCLIDEYAENYLLDVDSLPKHDISNFLELLMAHDTAIKDFILHNMQKMIDARLSHREIHDQHNAGLTFLPLSNGDTLLQRQRGYYDE
jgi:hypothetical protein